MKVQKLPAEARCKLQSGVLMTDAVQCVLELVHNSLDAEATGIAVRVDLKTYQIRVIDNGKGIGKKDLEFVGERFMTSKYHSSLETETSFCTYGFRGQALSSLQDVSRMLTIETKSEDNGSTLVKVFQNNKALPITETDSDRSGTGTIVTVDDFMYKMPVRRKRISEVFDLEEIKGQLEYLAIIHYNVCFTLRNENKGVILLQTPQASSVLESVTNIYGKTVAKALKALHYEENKYEVTGFISLKPQAQSNVQLLYINKRIISKGNIHKFVNKLVKGYYGKRSSFGDSPTGQILKQLKLLHNMYIIQIKCPHSYYELFTNVRKVTVEFRNWKDPLKYIHKAVKRAFKPVLKMDSSTNSQDQVDKNKEDNNNNNEKGKGVFGTSLLVNAVRGAAAKRHLHCKSVRKMKKRKKNDEKDKSVVLSKNSKILASDTQVVCNLNSAICQNEISNDSLETPIPKKSFKNVKQIAYSKLKKTDINQSFVEFYKWLKTKFETDPKAFNLYNDFLQFKNGTCLSEEVTEFRSPVLGGKPKRKHALKKKNLDKKPKTPTGDLSLLKTEMTLMTQRQQKIFPDQHLRMRKAVQFTAGMNADDPESINFNFVRNESGNFEMHKNQFKKPQSFSFMRREQQVEYSHTLQSLPSSEVQFTNIIKFRNMSESFFHQPSDYNRILPEKTFSESNSWVSHYQGSKNLEFYGKNQKMDSFVSWMKANEEWLPQRNKNFGTVSTPDGRLVEYANKKRKVQDVETQVNLSKLCAQKVHVMVQTFQEVPETPSIENSYIFSQGIGITAVENCKNNPEDQNKFLNENLSQQVPNPDFWNCTDHMEFEINNQNDLLVNVVTSNKSSYDITSKKNFTSNEFVCGHKSQVSTKVESTSKETQTLAAIWTDSLTELGYSTGNLNAGTPNLKNSGLENTQLSELNTVPKTIPIEEIRCDMAESGFCPSETRDFQINRDLTESRFCMTERHDFVPKGLSPKCLNPEPTTIASLSPNEKCKIQSTIDNAQNEFLATVKWQNESTGVCVKPALPDGIIFEMRRKAGENLMNYENPVLSATLSYCAVKVHNLLHSFAFTKELLSCVEVLGQLDKKFIVTKMKIFTPKKMELISLFDQHAADERIKLEELINEHISPDGKFVSSRLNPPVECTLTESDVRVVSDLKEKMLDFGLNAEPINGNTVTVNQVPSFLFKKHENNLKNEKGVSLSNAIKTLILNIIEEVTETRGSHAKIPKVMHNAFCLEACHKAIKFNKPLTAENMIEMIVKLQNCKLPFQCAHGRPSVIPLIDLEDFKSTMEENETVDLGKLKKFLNERKNDSVVENSKTA